MMPGSPSAEVSSLRLKTGDNLKMICRWNGGMPDWEFSRQVRNPSFIEMKTMPEFKVIRSGQCLGVLTCREKIVEAAFQPMLAGLYRCRAVPQEPFLIMWVNETVIINRPLVKKDGNNKPLRLTCSVNLLPADIEYRREVKWFITNDKYDSEDVSKCCTSDYLVDPGSSPGPMSLLIHSYDVSRDVGSFRCRVNVDGYGRELTNSTRIFAEAVTDFNITTGGRHSPVRSGQVVEALPGQQLNVTCTVRGYPGPSMIKLVQVGSQQLSVTKVIRSGLSATISINNLTDTFNDSFLCESTQEGLPFEPSSVASSQIVNVHVVNQLSPPERSEDESSSILTGTAQIIIIGITIPIVTIIIIVIVVRCWCQRKNRSRAGGASPAVRADIGAQRSSRSPAKPPRNKDGCETPLQSLSREDDRL